MNYPKIKLWRILGVSLILISQQGSAGCLDWLTGKSTSDLTASSSRLKKPVPNQDIESEVPFCTNTSNSHAFGSTAEDLVTEKESILRNCFSKETFKCTLVFVVGAAIGAASYGLISYLITGPTSENTDLLYKSLLTCESDLNTLKMSTFNTTGNPDVSTCFEELSACQKSSQFPNQTLSDCNAAFVIQELMVQNLTKIVENTQQNLGYCKELSVQLVNKTGELFGNLIQENWKSFNLTDHLVLDKDLSRFVHSTFQRALNDKDHILPTCIQYLGQTNFLSESWDHMKNSCIQFTDKIWSDVLENIGSTPECFLNAAQRILNQTSLSSFSPGLKSECLKDTLQKLDDQLL